MKLLSRLVFTGLMLQSLVLQASHSKYTFYDVETSQQFDSVLRLLQNRIIYEPLYEENETIESDLFRGTVIFFNQEMVFCDEKDRQKKVKACSDVALQAYVSSFDLEAQMDRNFVCYKGRYFERCLPKVKTFRNRLAHESIVVLELFKKIKRK